MNSSHTNHVKAGPPYLGAAYYPEDWPTEQIDQDIDLMQRAGMNVMRIGEFAWSCMEPHEGDFQLEWLHRVVDRLAVAGIATIMCTPSATPPIWLTEKYPETLFVREDGSRVQHGSRRHTCPNSPVYRQLCTRIVERLAKEFGNNPNVIGWQIDNEVYAYYGNRMCRCPVCMERFQEWLLDRYGSIENLNKAWGTNLWSQTYETFEQIPYPEKDVWHHPSLQSAWDAFADHSYQAFVASQAVVLHQHVSQPVGTDMMMITGIDHWKINEHLDVVQYNHYHFRESLYHSIFWFNYLRPIKPQTPFWNTETATGWGGGVFTTGYCQPGFCRANSWLPIALGGEANCYWLWRQHWTGHELMHGAVVSSSGRPLHMFGEVQEISSGYHRASDFLTRTKPAPAQVGIHCSNQASITFKNQPMVQGFDYLRDLVDFIHQPLVSKQYHVDVISPAASLEQYRILVSAYLPWLDEAGLSGRLRKWIEEGGIWIVGPLSDCRNADWGKYTHAPFGWLEEWTGLYCHYQIPGDPENFEIRWSDGRLSSGQLWFDAFDTTDQEVLAEYTQNELAGKAAITTTQVGKGMICVVGCGLPPTDWVNLFEQLAKPAGIQPALEATDNLLVVPRQGAGLDGYVVVEYANRPGRIKVPNGMVEILTEQSCTGWVDVMPYQVKIFKTDKPN